MKLQRRELGIGLSFLLGLSLLYFFCQNWRNEELSEFLLKEEKKFAQVQISDLKDSMVKEWKRRLSWHYYTGSHSKALELLKNRYQVKDVSLVWEENATQKESVRWLGGFRFQLSIQDRFYTLVVTQEESRQLMIDGAASLIQEMREQSRGSDAEPGLSFLLEDSTGKLPGHVQDYAMMARKFSGLAHGNLVYYGAPFLQEEFQLHRVTVIDSMKLQSVFWFRFLIGTFGLIFLMGLYYLLEELRSRQLDVYFRMISWLLVLIPLVALLFYQDSQRLYEETRLKTRYQRELEILEKGQLEVLKPAYERIRHQLPFQEDGVYSLYANNSVLLFQARISGVPQLLGRSYETEDRSISKDFLITLLLFLFGFGFYGSIGRSRSRFMESLKASIAGLRKGKSELLEPAFTYPEEREIWENYSSMRSKVLEREVQQKFLSRELFVSLKKQVNLDLTGESSELESTILWLSPGNQEELMELAAQQYFDTLQSYLAYVREVAMKYGGIPFLDHTWSQGILFVNPREAIARQRAIICGLDLARRLPQKSKCKPVSCLVMNSQLSFHLLQNRYRQEILVNGVDFRVLEDQLIQIRENQSENSRVYFKDQGTALKHVALLFELAESSESQDWIQVYGVKDVAQHMGLLQFPDEDLQKTALELVSLQTDLDILDQLLETVPQVGEGVLPLAVDALSEYLAHPQGREKIFQKIQQWSKEQDLQSIRVVLSIYEKDPSELSLGELEVLLGLEYEELEEYILTLILQNFPQEYGDKLNQKLEKASLILKAHWKRICFQRNPDSESLNQLLTYLEDCSPQERSRIMEEIRLAWENSPEGKAVFDAWLGENIESFQARIREGLSMQDRELAFRTLSLIASLNLQSFYKDLVHMFQESYDNEWKLEISYTLKQLGADSFLLQGLN